MTVLDSEFSHKKIWWILQILQYSVFVNDYQRAHHIVVLLMGTHDRCEIHGSQVWECYTATWRNSHDSSSFLPILQGRTYSMPKWLGNFRELRRPRSGEFFVSYSLPSIPFLLARTLSTARVLPQRRSFLRAIFDDGV